MLCLRDEERGAREREGCTGKYNMLIRRVFRFSFPDDLKLTEGSPR